jgi:prepilin-type N-terminal cleavage/methylation domain-containing protein/prepilin-type processing-associated H-X9-DG protein
MRKLKAFTLVELLVVISIIALLLSVLLPSLRSAKEQAEMVVCKSNIKNYGLAGSMYLDDNGGVFPHPNYCIFSYNSAYNQPGDGHPFQCCWHDPDIKYDGYLIPYLKEVGAHCCPTFKSIAKKRGAQHGDSVHAAPHDPAIPIEPRYSYTINGYLSNGNEYEDISGFSPEYRMPNLADVEAPAETLFATEENIWVINTSNGDRLNLSILPMQEFYFFPLRYGQGDCIATFHRATDIKLNNGYSNVVFIDGHVGTEKAYDDKDLNVYGFSDYSWTLTTHSRNPVIWGRY